MYQDNFTFVIIGSILITCKQCKEKLVISNSKLAINATACRQRSMSALLVGNMAECFIPEYIHSPPKEFFGSNTPPPSPSPNPPGNHNFVHTFL